MNLPGNLAAGLAWIGLAIVSWGPMFPLAKRTLPVIDAFALNSIRYAIGGALFVLLLARFEGRGAIGYSGRLPRAILFGVIGITGYNSLVWYGLNFTRPEHAAIIMVMQSPLAALAGWMLRGQRPANFTLGCVAVAILGVLAVVTRGEPAAALADFARGGALFGDLVILAGAACWVAYSFGGATFTGWSALRFTALTCIPGMFGLFAVNVITVASGFSTVPSPGTIAGSAVALVYFSVGSVVLGILGFNAGVKHLGPLNAMLMLNLIPVSVFSIEAALGRSFVAIELAGAATVIGALVANNLYLRRHHA